jgi:hypothetical protein
MKKFADTNRTPRNFAEGDVVYLKMQPYREKALGLGNDPKLTSKYYGPFRVLKKVGTLAYKLQLPPGTLLHDVFHVNQLKKHLGPKAVPNAKLPMLTPQGKLKVKPQAILETRQVPHRARDYDVAVPQWLVHWENMTADEATWEDAHYMMATFPGFLP